MIIKEAMDVLEALQLFVGYEKIIHVTFKIFLYTLNKQTNQMYDIIIT